MPCLKAHVDYPGGASETSTLLATPSDAGPTSNTRWRLGISLAVVSGLLFTGNNFMIQYYDVNAFEILLVRSVLQTIVLGMIAANSGAGGLLPSTWIAR